MTSTILGEIGAIIVALAAMYYIYDIIWGKTRPQRVTWGVWTIVAILGVSSSLSAGAGPGVFAAAVYSVAYAITFAISLFPKYGKPGGRWYDWVIGAIAIAMLALWQFGGLDVNIAALAAVGAEAIVTIPTIRGAWRDPATESVYAWSADAVGNLLAVLALANLRFASAAYPVYLLFITTAVAILLIVRIRNTKIFAEKNLYLRDISNKRG